MIGISLYSGLEYSLTDNLAYMERASAIGIKYVYTSLHIPEANNNVYKEAQEILSMAKRLGMQVIADISKQYMDRIDINQLGLHALRLDFGYTPEEIAQLSRECPFKIQLNASTISEQYMEKLVRLGTKTGNLEVCHNYYPRKDTGISYGLLMERNRCFRKYDLKITAFIPSQNQKRSPVHDGLPTLECHRSIRPVISAQHLLHSDVDMVYIGDAFASDEELKSLIGIQRNIYTIPIALHNPPEAEMQVLSGIHTNRTDPGEYVIRSQEARLKRTQSILKRNTLYRKKYAVTIDNEGYKRYEGELQILKKDFESDERVNVVGDASEAKLLIEMIKPGDAFEFAFPE